MDCTRVGVSAIASFTVLMLSASVASAQKTEFAFGIGYSHLSLDDAPGELDQQDGGRFEGRFSWRPFDDRPQLRFGVGVGFSYYYDQSDAGNIISPPFAFGVDSFESLSLITPEFQVSWRQPMSEKWWIEGGVGIGPAIGYYSAGDVIFEDLFDEDVSETEVGLGVRPFLRAGFRGSEDWRWGFEGSYQWTDIDFGRFGRDPDEWYVGLFIAFGR
jgi:hypothetical protein